MSPKDILKAKLAGQKTERNLFCPAIYEHKAKLIGKSIAQVATDPKLLEEAVLVEYETYQSDMLTIGIDIYNIEAQALGAEVIFSEKPDVVPSIKEKILTDISDIDKLQMPPVSTAGRVPLLLEVSKKINLLLGRNVLVRGALSGPYSIAAELIGIEPLIMAMMSDEKSFVKLLDFTTSFVIAFGKEYINNGISICLFDSQASPPLISPEMFKTFLLPRYQKIAHEFKTAGCECSELVIGGQTDPIAVSVLNSGFDIVLCDYPCEAKSYFNQQTQAYPLIRRNISPILIEQGDFEAIQSKITETKQLANDFNNLVIGTGVLSYNVPSENIVKTKQMCLEN
jgi:uroporphyrinogen decarboxylase